MSGLFQLLKLRVEQVRFDQILRLASAMTDLLHAKSFLTSNFALTASLFLNTLRCLIKTLNQ